MPRSRPEYKWTTVSTPRLKEEAHSHQMKGKGRGKRYTTSSAPKQLSKRSSAFSKDVHYGSHSSLYRAIEEASRGIK